MVDSKETQKEIPLAYFFGESQGSIKDIFGVEPSVKTFLNEDKNSPRKIEIAKKVYKEYSKIGLAGKAFVNRGEYEELLILQDYKLTLQDYNVIENYLENVKKHGMQHSADILTKKLFSEEAKEAMNKIIDNESDINNLNKLGDYCSNLGHRTSFEPLAIIIEKKIECLKLDAELEVKNDSSKPKAKKIKI